MKEKNTQSEIMGLGEVGKKVNQANNFTIDLRYFYINVEQGLPERGWNTRPA